MNEQEGKVRSLTKAIDLLDLLAASRDGMKLGELSARAGYPKSTVHALLSTMRDRGLVTQRDDGRYALGLRLFEYGSAVSRGFDIAALSRPYLERLSNLTGANAVISMIDGAGVVAFDYAASATGIQILPEIGVRLPLHATSQGKLALSCLSSGKALGLLKQHGAIPYTPHTIAEPETLMRELETIRARGYAVEDGEYKIGLRSVSAPVYDSAGEAKYVLTTIGFFRRVASEEFSSAITATVEQARRLSAAMGYQWENG
jgi:IclR family acetate operon transcriptional repressor